MTRVVERICGLGYVIVTEQQEDGRYLTRGIVLGGDSDFMVSEWYSPEGACGIRLNIVDKVRAECLKRIRENDASVTA